MEKHALLKLLMKANPALLRKLLVGRPNIKIFQKMAPLAKAQLAAGRKLLEAESGIYRNLIQAGLKKGVKDKALIGAALGSALGAGSLGWSLAKENPETESRLAKLLTELLFLPEEESTKGRQEAAPQVSPAAETAFSPPTLSLSGLLNNSNVIDWGAE